nr:uncharacterized protein LOC113822248 [Penaeus vannamei]
MEEQMIFGALQTLNEEACEDVLEEQEKADLAPTASHLSTITSGETGEGEASAVNGGEEMDVMFLQSSPLLSHRVVSAPTSDVESTAPSHASSFSPYKPNNVSLSRASSLRCSSTSTSPKHSTSDKPLGVPTLRNEGRESSPIGRISVSNNSSPLRRSRPQSLNLGRGLHDPDASSPDTPQQDNLKDGEIPQASLPDLPGAVAGMKHVTLAEQFSSNSMEKLRRLKYKLHRALGSHDGPLSFPSDDAETSPLVLATPTRPSPVTTPDPEVACQNANSIETSSRPLTPLLKNAHDSSPGRITCKLPSADRETPV